MYVCDECKSKETYVNDYEFKFDIKGKEYSVESKRRFCRKCNNFIYDEALDNALIRKVFRKKEEVMGIEPEKIIELRKKFDLTQEQFSKIIGCAKKTLISYEKGESFPNEIYLVTIKTLLDNPGVIKYLVDSNEERYEDEELKKIKDKIKNFSVEEERELTDFNGYSYIDPNKIYNLIAVLCDEGVLKTKLLKEMFYCDFVYYENTCASLTGLEYAKITYGPVPDNYEEILRYLEKEGYIEIKVEYKDNYEMHMIKSLVEVDKNAFTEDELKIINKVKDYFKDYSVKEIVDRSHQEKAFLNTKNGELISYDYSFDIELD